MKIIPGFIPSLALLNLPRSCLRLPAGTSSKPVVESRVGLLVMEEQVTHLVQEVGDEGPSDLIRDYGDSSDWEGRP